MGYQIAASAVVALHFAFIVFAVFGVLLVARHHRWAWAHLPAVAWVAYIEFFGRVCPLTPLENTLRERAGVAGYEGDFVAHYLLPVIYPVGLTPAIQIFLGIIVVLFNAMAYGWIWQRRRARMAILK